MSSLVLLYHVLESPVEAFVTENAADQSVVVSASNFVKHLHCLKKMGKRVISLDEMLRKQTQNSGSEQVVISFDDGHKSNWSLAFPALQEAGAVAVFYIIAGKVDKDPDYLTSTQLRELDAHGMLIGSHSMTHSFLSELNREDVHMELADSREHLEDIIGRPILDLAIPGGHFNKTTLEEAKQCGYRSIATCKIGFYHHDDDPYEIRRVEIRQKLSLEEFRNTFTRSKLFQLQMIEASKALLRKSLGLRVYSKLRQFGHTFFDLTR